MIRDAYAVILAGGRGERFWPLSTSERPKQFLTLIGGKPLLAQAVDRLRGLLPPERIFIITHADLVMATRSVAPRIPPDNVIGEPFGRDTAAACALALALVRARSPQGVFCVLTADQLIKDLEVFRATLRAGLKLAHGSESLITIGIRPAYASTGFGYIEAGKRVQKLGKIEFLEVQRFVEKPDASTAKRFVATGRYYWNSGMFMWSVASLERALATYRPELSAMARRIAATISTSRFEASLRKEYQNLEKISIDYAIMEKAKNILMAKGVFRWDDVGSWPALANHLKPTAGGNIVVGDCTAVDSAGNLVVSEGRLTALLGVHDLVVVHSGRASLICPKERAQELKKIIRALAEHPRYRKLL